RERGAGASVVFTGKVPHHEVLDYYALYDTFVVPRVDERAARLVTPLKPYEAMAMGIPLVVSDLPALAEITGHGQRGATFATGNAQSLTEVLAGLINDPTRREGLADAARAWVLRERDWSHNGARYQSIYDEVRRSRSTS
ncbi:MAG: glycosyltransferase, partial [Ornithinimicrobium sp.]